MAVTCAECGRVSEGFESRCPECDATLPLGSTLGLVPGIAGPDDELTGQSIGRFHIEGVLGRGGMGVVYRAMDSQLERPVALKFISAAMASDPVARQRFEREARAAARLDNPSVGAIYEIGQHQGRPWIAMAYYPGETLAQRLESGPLPPNEARRVADSLIEALDVAHRAGIVHRDVKPANIMLTPEGKVKLLDFGLAKLDTASAMTRSGQAMGTLGYMAPEQLLGEAIDARVDLWSVAVVWVEMLSGQKPFRGEGRGFAVMRSILDDAPDLEGVPETLRPILQRCLSKKADDRPESMAVLRSQLADSGSQNPLSTAESALTPVERPRRRVGPVALLLVALVGLVVALGVLDRSEPSQPSAEVAPTAAQPVTGATLRRVAVAPTQATIRVPGADPEVSRTGVRIALLRALSGLDGLRPLAPDQLEGLPGSIVEQAAAAGADEVLASNLDCEPERCTLELSLLRTDDGSVVWSDDGATFSWGDKQLAALATATSARRAFPGHTARDGALSFDMAKEDFLELATLWNAYDKRSLPRRELLDRLSALRRRVPGFVEIYLLEIDAARLLFFETREGALLDHGSRIAEQARQLAPWDAMPLFKQFDLARQGRRIDEAEAVLAELERLRPGEPGVLHCQAQLAEMKGDAETAIEKMTEAVGLRPTWRRLQTLAHMEFRHGLVTEARAHVEQLLTLSPDNYEGLRLLATIELTTGEPERAEALLEHLVAEHPEPTDLMDLGAARLFVRRYDEAELAMRQALELGDHPGAYLNLADSLALQGRHDEAEPLYRQTLERVAEDPAPDSLAMLLVKAQALAHLGRAAEAVAAAQSALTQMPNSANVAYEVSLVQAVVGERHSALLNAERALALGVNPHWFEHAWFEPLRDEIDALVEEPRSPDASD